MRTPKRKRVLFICIGNCCRSQIAEGFARHHGSDVLEAESAGLAPAGVVVPQTVHTMAERGIDISSHHSKPLRVEDANKFDVLVNMSGFDLPEAVRVPVRDWDVPDPIGQPESIYCEVRDQIEALVNALIQEYRADTDLERPAG